MKKKNGQIVKVYQQRLTGRHTLRAQAFVTITWLYCFELSNEPASFKASQTPADRTIISESDVFLSAQSCVQRARAVGAVA